MPSTPWPDLPGDTRPRPRTAPADPWPSLPPTDQKPAATRDTGVAGRVDPEHRRRVDAEQGGAPWSA
jgi:hypothetical protein